MNMKKLFLLNLPYLLFVYPLGGMAHGLSERMDGRILWAAEPEGIPRMTERMDALSLIHI